MKTYTDSAASFAALLDELDACDDARRWARGKTLAEAWATCRRGDWMLWLAEKMRTAGYDPLLTAQDAARIAVACARRAVEAHTTGELRATCERALDAGTKCAYDPSGENRRAAAAADAARAYAAANAAANAAAAARASAAAYAPAYAARAHPPACPAT